MLPQPSQDIAPAPAQHASREARVGRSSALSDPLVDRASADVQRLGKLHPAQHVVIPARLLAAHSSNYRQERSQGTGCSISQYLAMIRDLWEASPVAEGRLLLMGSMWSDDEHRLLRLRVLTPADRLRKALRSDLDLTEEQKRLLWELYLELTRQPSQR